MKNEFLFLSLVNVFVNKEWPVSIHIQLSKPYFFVAVQNWQACEVFKRNQWGDWVIWSVIDQFWHASSRLMWRERRYHSDQGSPPYNSNSAVLVLSTVASCRYPEIHPTNWMTRESECLVGQQNVFDIEDMDVQTLALSSLPYISMLVEFMKY